MRATIAETARLCLNVVLGVVASAPAARAPLVAWSFRMTKYQGARGDTAPAILGTLANAGEHKPRANETPLDRLFTVIHELDELSLFVAEALGTVFPHLPTPMRDFLAAAYPVHREDASITIGDLAVRYHEIIREEYP